MEITRGAALPVCTYGLSGCRVKPRRLWGFTPRTPNVHISGPSASNTTKIPRNDPQREREREKKRRTKMEAGEGKKKREILGPTTTLRMPHPSGGLNKCDFTPYEILVFWVFPIFSVFLHHNANCFVLSPLAFDLPKCQ